MTKLGRTLIVLAPLLGSYGCIPSSQPAVASGAVGFTGAELTAPLEIKLTDWIGTYRADPAGSEAVSFTIREIRSKLVVNGHYDDKIIHGTFDPDANLLKGKLEFPKEGSTELTGHWNPYRHCFQITASGGCIVYSADLTCVRSEER